jgi:hypothetical protein
LLTGSNRVPSRYIYSIYIYIAYIIAPIHKRVIKLTNNYCRISLLSTSYQILSNILLLKLSPYVDEIIGVGFDVIDPVIIRFYAFVRYWRVKAHILFAGNSGVGARLIVPSCDNSLSRGS